MYLRNYLQDMLVNIIREIKISSRMFVICMNNKYIYFNYQNY